MAKKEHAQDFGEALREYRKMAVGLGEKTGQTQLVAMAHGYGWRSLTQRDVSRYEAGLAIPTLEKFAAIVDTLGLTDREIRQLIQVAYPRPVSTKRHSMSQPLHSLSSRREKSSEPEVEPPNTSG